MKTKVYVSNRFMGDFNLGNLCRNMYISEYSPFDTAEDGDVWVTTNSPYVYFEKLILNKV